MFQDSLKREFPKVATMSDELLLDPDIRVWVFLPIIVITFFVGILRHYVSILLHSTKKVELQQVIDSQTMIKSRLLRENGRYIPKQVSELSNINFFVILVCLLPFQSFLMRRHYFNNEETGYFKVSLKRNTQAPNPMTDPSMMTDMLKGNLTNVLPMILIGGWINWTFSGFVTTKVPFPLTLRFKPMLQRGIELQSLDASWVSSASWYFLNVFGLRSIYVLVLGENNAADQSRVMQDQMSGAAMAMPADPKQAFKGEWEALEICNHNWILHGIENKLLQSIENQ